MKAQNVASGGSDAGMMGSFNQAVMEVNPAHPIVQDLEHMVKGVGEEVEDPKNFATLLYDVAALTSGYEIKGWGDFAQRILAMMTTRAKGDAMVGAEVEAEAAPPEDESEEKSEDD